MVDSIQTPPTPGAPARRGSLLVIFLTVFVDLLGFAIVLPLLPLYGKAFTQHYQWSPLTQGIVLGLLMASFSIMQFFFGPVWGKLSDRFGRRPILIIGLTGSAGFYLLFGVSTVFKSLVGLFLARIGAGIAGATISTAQAYIADTTTKDDRAKGMALIGAAFALGFTLGPAIGAGAVMIGEAWPGFVAAAFSTAALILAVFKLPESSKLAQSRVGPASTADHGEPHKTRWIDTKALREPFQLFATQPSIALLLLTTFIAVFSFANFETTLALQIERFVASSEVNDMPSEAAVTSANFTPRSESPGTEDSTGRWDAKLIVVLLVFTVLGFTLAIAQGLLVRRLATRMAEGAMAVLGCSLAIGAFLLLAAAARAGSFGWLMAGMVAEVIGFSFVNPSVQALISRRTPADQQGGVLGLGQSASSLARICGPVGIPLFTLMVDAPYWLAAVLMAIALLLVGLALPRGKDFDGHESKTANGAPNRFGPV